RAGPVRRRRRHPGVAVRQGARDRGRHRLLHPQPQAGPRPRPGARAPPVALTQGWPYGRSLEIGAGTGFFTLNLKLAGVLDEAHVTDLSPGMVEAAKRNADHLGLTVQ